MEEQTTWAETRRRYIERFDGQNPAWDDDEDAAVAFSKHPAAIIAALEELADHYAARKIHSPWRVFAKRLTRIELEHTTVSVSRDRLVHLAENWIRNAGVMYDREDEIVDALFTAVDAPLRAWAGDELLQARLAALWRTERPRGEQAEAEQIERAERWKQAQER